MEPAWLSGRLNPSSSSSGNEQSQAVIESHLSTSFERNSSNLIPELTHSTLGSNIIPVSGGVSPVVVNSMPNSVPGVIASSLATYDNSDLSGGGPSLQRSTSISAEFYLRLLAPPLLFSSSNISISGPSVMDGSSVVQPSPPRQYQDHQNLQQRDPSPASLPSSKIGEVLLSNGPRVSGSFFKEPSILCQVHKRPRLDIKQDLLQPQVVDQLPQSQASMQLQGNNPQLQTSIQQQRLRQQQQQSLQSMPEMQQAQLQSKQSQMQSRHQLPQQRMQQSPAMQHIPGVCARQLLKYQYHQRQRPAVSFSPHLFLW